MENGGLLNATKPEELEADQSTWKIVVLALIGAAFSFICGYFLAYLLAYLIIC